MVNRERFMLDVDSEGFPHRYDEPPHPTLSLIEARLGHTADHAVVQAMLADHRCIPCNPPGWDEVDGVKLPPIDWAVVEENIGAPATAHMREWAEENFGAIGAKGDLLRSMQDCANVNHDGITRLSDNYAPDAFYGWKR